MSWEQLLDIQREAVQMAAEEMAKERTDCPNDGTLLVRNAEGVWGCTFCNWRSNC